MTSTESIIEAVVERRSSVANVNELEIHNAKSLRNQENKIILHLSIKTAIYVLLWAHFIWATYQFITESEQSFSETACNGYGFWVIVFGFINFSIVFMFFIKPYILPLFRRLIWEPTAELLGNIRQGKIIFYLIIVVSLSIYLIIDTTNDRTRLIPLFGLGLFLLIGFIVSTARTQIPWSTIFWGIMLQFLFGILTIRLEFGRNALNCVGDKVNTFLSYANNGSSFVYGNFLIYEKGVFAFQALAAIFFLNFIINILYYYGIMQNIVLNLGRFLQWVMGTSICESVNAASNIFLGMSESPLILKPYLAHLTDSELHSIMTSGFASVAGTVLAAYISFGANPAHLITACVMSAPAALAYSKMIHPETEEVVATKQHIKQINVEFQGVLDAASKGAHEAFGIVSGVLSSLIAFISFMAFLDGILSWMGALVGYAEPDQLWTLDLFLGKAFMPLSLAMGVPWDECEKVGKLIGIKTVVNEFAAFQRMSAMDLTPKSKLIATYAICGFSNPGSVGITVSMMSTLVPHKKQAVADLVLRAFVGGAIVCFMTACIAAVLVPEEAM